MSAQSSASDRQIQRKPTQQDRLGAALLLALVVLSAAAGVVGLTRTYATFLVAGESIFLHSDYPDSTTAGP